MWLPTRSRRPACSLFSNSWSSPHSCYRSHSPVRPSRTCLHGVASGPGRRASRKARRPGRREGAVAGRTAAASYQQVSQTSRCISEQLVCICSKLVVVFPGKRLIFLPNHILYFSITFICAQTLNIYPAICCIGLTLLADLAKHEAALQMFLLSI